MHLPALIVNDCKRKCYYKCLFRTLFFFLTSLKTAQAKLFEPITKYLFSDCLSKLAFSIAQFWYVTFALHAFPRNRTHNLGIASTML